MIHSLLERPDEKVRFFGALTIIIKLNKERCVGRSPVPQKTRLTTCTGKLFAQGCRRE